MPVGNHGKFGTWGNQVSITYTLQKLVKGSSPTSGTMTLKLSRRHPKECEGAIRLAEPLIPVNLR